ncbi:MAG: hypothetical protein JEY79_05610 [Pseudodesulfovibrio sp.]|nr:hypothetical protein [Pseudodesulfovibrio sp.]
MRIVLFRIYLIAILGCLAFLAYGFYPEPLAMMVVVVAASCVVAAAWRPTIIRVALVSLPTIFYTLLVLYAAYGSGFRMPGGA